MILIIKIIDIGVNEFYFMRRVSPRCFFSFSLPEETNLPARIFLGSG
jgi:hypothetical protein